MKDNSILYLIGGGALLLLLSRIGERIMVTASTKRNFKKTMQPIAEAIERNYGIKPNITITQSALESRWGVSGLTQRANNLFGFTKGSWTGAVVYMPTREYIAGVWVTVNRPFRKYKSWFDSVNNWAKIISGLSRYTTAYKYAKLGDINRFAQAVKEGGYATDPKYVTKIINTGKEVEAITLAGLGEVSIPPNADKIKFVKKKDV